MNISGIFNVGNVALKAGMTLQEFLHDIGLENTQLVLENGIHKWYSLPRSLWGGREFSGRVLFNNGVISRISLGFPANTNWNHYDEASERQAAKDNEAWVKTYFGQPCPAIFSWGRVSAGFSTQDGGNYVVITFT